MPINSLATLVTAYRKAKVDLYYSTDPRLRDLVEYEEALGANLERLRRKIADSDDNWVEEPEFYGTFTFLPKRFTKVPATGGNALWSDLSKSWKHKTRAARDAGEPVVAEFRLMSRCSIDMHVLSTLWMLEVGTKLDSRLSTSARGSRLRRGLETAPDTLKPGSFEHYPTAYRRWRDDGLRAMTEALDERKALIAATADVASFYHRLDPAFLLDPRFRSQILGVGLSPDQRKLTKLFVKALRAWSRGTAAELTAEDGSVEWSPRGLPVGLPASAVVANLALAELDTFLEGLEPEFYGRYVDDITLVLEGVGEMDSQSALWRWLAERSEGLLHVRPDPNSATETVLSYEPPYLRTSTVVFANSKNKIFHLSGPSGQAAIESIKATIQERNSEWRSLANVPGGIAEIEPALTSLRRSDGDSAANLREADEVSARKAAFAVRLRDFEVYERTLRPEDWKNHRTEFVRVACQQVMTLPSFADLAKYYPRLITLTAACHDRHSTTRLFRSVGRLPSTVASTCELSVSAHGPLLDESGRRLVLERWAAWLHAQSIESLLSGWRSDIDREALGKMLAPLERLRSDLSRPDPSASELQQWHGRLACRDLAHHPYQWSVLEPASPDRVEPELMEALPLENRLRDAANLLTRVMAQAHPLPIARSGPGDLDPGIVLATRPPTMLDLYEALPATDADRYGVPAWEMISSILEGLRGYAPTSPTEFETSEEGFPTVLLVPNHREGGPIRLALAMLETSVHDAIAAADGHPHTTSDRMEHLKELLKAVGKCAVGVNNAPVDYLMLPELSMPRKWFKEFAYGLRRSGISLIAGIEHQPYGPDLAANQVWAALKVGGRGYNYFLHKQDKQRAAKPEMEQVLGPAGRTLKPLIRWPAPEPPVLAHGDFRFALLICSEFTNIEYRARLRGAVDAILIPEWNQDLPTFEALVESAALDVHAYIAQSNTRGLGDTRIRAPMKRDWARDVVRLKGGVSDYFVVGEIDVDALRRAHWKRPPIPPLPGEPDPAEFKPTPDGFDPDPRRKVLPVHK